MGMKSKKAMLPALLLCLTLLLCGCRTRTNGSTEIPLTDAAESRTDETKQGESASREAERTETGDSGENSDRTKENPEASRKEYDENAPAEIVPGTDRLLHEAGEGNGASAANTDAERAVSMRNDQAEEAATQTVAAQEAEQRGVSEDAAAAESAFDYFTVLLQDRMGSLFECQRMNVYWETAQDHVTVHKTSPEHTLILNAGCYDVSARLLMENLLVDDGWVARKNPGVIVKMVDGSILGGGVGSDRAAKVVYESLQSRDGWASVDAVKNRRVLLLSRELMDAPYLQTAAMLMIAKTANPDLFTDVDLNEALQMLAEEAAGTLPAGVYFFGPEN